MLLSIEKIRLDLIELQDEINMVAAMLPATMRIEFNVFTFQRPDELLARDSLVIRVMERPSD